MPRGDRTGPLGQGPRTGRGGGYCNGNAVPGFVDDMSRGRGPAFGRRQGRGRWGRRQAFSAVPVNTPPIQDSLPSAGPIMDQIDGLHERLDFLQNQVAELTRLMKQEYDISEPKRSAVPKDEES